MSQSVGGWSAADLVDDDDVDLEGVIGSITQTVPRVSARGSSPAIAVGRKQPLVDAAPPQLPKSAWSEHPPAVSIAVDRGYEMWLAKKKLAVTHEGEDEGVTVPIPRGHIPAMLHSVAVAPPVKPTRSHAWKRFAMGAAVGILAVVGVAVVVL